MTLVAPIKTRYGVQYVYSNLVGGSGNRIDVINENDSDGNPAGGSVSGAGFMFCWQNGPVDRDAGAYQNGAFVEDIIEAARTRLDYYQNGKFACPENDEALAHLEAALVSLSRRRHARRVQGVEGEHLPHVSQP